MGRKKSNSKIGTIADIVATEEIAIMKEIASRQLPLFSERISGARKALDALETNRWAIAMYWVAYKRYPSIDIARKPFNTPSFKLWERWGYVLNAQLDLCQVVFDATRKFYPQEHEKLKRKYLAPLHWWAQCMQEYRDKEGSEETELKEGFIIRLKSHIQLLKSGEKQESKYTTPINDTLFNLAAKLSTKDPDVKIKIEAYCYQFAQFIEKDAPKLISYRVERIKSCNKKEETALVCRGRYSMKQAIPSATLKNLESNLSKLVVGTPEIWENQSIWIREFE